MMVAGERPGATLAGTVGRGGLEGLKGLAAGQSSAAKQQLALATLGARQEANRIASAKKSTHEVEIAGAMRDKMKTNPEWFDENGQPKDTRFREWYYNTLKKPPQDLAQALARDKLATSEEKFLKDRSVWIRRAAQDYMKTEAGKGLTRVQAEDFIRRKLLNDRRLRTQGSASIDPASSAVGDPTAKVPLEDFLSPPPTT